MNSLHFIWAVSLTGCNRISIFWMEQIELCKIVSVNVIKYLGEFYLKKEMWFSLLLFTQYYGMLTTFVYWTHWLQEQFTAWNQLLPHSAHRCEMTIYFPVGVWQARPCWEIWFFIISILLMQVQEGKSKQKWWFVNKPLILMST